MSEASWLCQPERCSANRTFTDNLLRAAAKASRFAQNRTSLQVRRSLLLLGWILFKTQTPCQQVRRRPLPAVREKQVIATKLETQSGDSDTCEGTWWNKIVTSPLNIHSILRRLPLWQLSDEMHPPEVLETSLVQRRDLWRAMWGTCSGRWRPIPTYLGRRHGGNLSHSLIAMSLG